MTLQEFKCEAQRRGHNYDNSANAAAHWAKSWGLTYHSLLWFLRELHRRQFDTERWQGAPSSRIAPEC